MSAASGSGGDSPPPYRIPPSAGAPFERSGRRVARAAPAPRAGRGWGTGGGGGGGRGQARRGGAVAGGEGGAGAAYFEVPPLGQRPRVDGHVGEPGGERREHPHHRGGRLGRDDRDPAAVAGL